MKKSNLIVEVAEGKEVYDLLFNVEAGEKNYIIYTKNELNECGDIIAYAASYDYSNGSQKISPIEDADILEFLDVILLQIQSKMNNGEADE